VATKQPTKPSSKQPAKRQSPTPDRNLSVADLMALPPDALLTIPESMMYLATSERNLRRFIYERRIASIKLGGLIRIRKRALDAYLDSQTREAQAS
jgi:excisionase family DNA binding protein